MARVYGSAGCLAHQTYVQVLLPVIVALLLFFLVNTLKLLTLYLHYIIPAVLAQSIELAHAVLVRTLYVALNVHTFVTQNLGSSGLYGAAFYFLCWPVCSANFCVLSICHCTRRAFLSLCFVSLLCTNCVPVSSLVQAKLCFHFFTKKIKDAQ